MTSTFLHRVRSAALSSRGVIFRREQVFLWIRRATSDILKMRKDGMFMHIIGESMKKAILLVIMVMVAAPCLAEVEPDGFFSVDGTLWGVCNIEFISNKSPFFT